MNAASFTDSASMSTSSAPLLEDSEDLEAGIIVHKKEQPLVSKAFLACLCMFLGLYTALVIWSLSPGDTTAVVGPSVVSSVFLAALCLFLASYVALVVLSLSPGDDVAIFTTAYHINKPLVSQARSWTCILLGLYIAGVIWSLSADLAVAIWHLLSIGLFLWAAAVFNDVSISTALPPVSISFLTALCLGLGVYIAALIWSLTPSDAVAIFGAPTISASLSAVAPKILACEVVIELLLLVLLYASYFSGNQQQFLLALSISSVATTCYAGVFYLILSLPGTDKSGPFILSCCIMMALAIECSGLALVLGRGDKSGNTIAEYERGGSTMTQGQHRESQAPISFV
jgi:hypothetical protein